jgi:uncharacterized protein (TIGR03083 family)
MKRDELTDALEAARAKLDAAIDGLSAEELEAPGLAGDWSIKDFLAHVTAWDVDLLTNLGKVKRGLKPGRTQWNRALIQEQNEAWHKDLGARPLDRVLADYDAVHAQVLKAVQALSDTELEAPADWLQGRPLYQYFVDHIVVHEDEHGAQIAEWRQHRQ